MVVKKIDVYKDGGTVLIATDGGVFYIDNRLDSKTKKELFFVYPDKGDPILEPKRSELRIKLTEAMNNYKDRFYSNEHIQAIIKDLN